MFRSSLCLLLTLAACNPPDAGVADTSADPAEAALPLGTVAPPAVLPMDLRAKDLFIAPGEPLVLKAGKVRPGASVRFLMSRAGPGPGRCDLPLAGACLNIQEPTQLVATATANSNGIATFGTRQSLAPGEYTFQAVVVGGQVRKSSVVTVSVVGPCVDDLLEDNDTVGSATAYTAPVDAHSCDNDLDVFTFTVPDGIALIADASFSRRDGDLDMELRNAAGTSLAYGASSDSNETVRWFNDTGAAVTVYVATELFSDDNLGGIPYTFSLRTEDPHTCGDLDAGEDDDTLATAQAAGVGLYDAESCDGDDDWYALELEAGDVVDAQLGFDPLDADLDLYLLDEVETVVAYSAREGREERLTKRIRTAGTYYIVVNMWDDEWEIPTDGGAPYSLDIDVLAP